MKAIILFAAVLLCTSCELHERVEVERIDPPQIENETITVPDWEQQK